MSAWRCVFPFLTRGASRRISEVSEIWVPTIEEKKKSNALEHGPCDVPNKDRKKASKPFTLSQPPLKNPTELRNTKSCNAPCVIGYVWSELSGTATTEPPRLCPRMARLSPTLEPAVGRGHTRYLSFFSPEFSLFPGTKIKLEQCEKTKKKIKNMPTPEKKSHSEACCLERGQRRVWCRSRRSRRRRWRGGRR